MTTQLERAPAAARPATVHEKPVVFGRVSRGYERVREAFAANFTTRDELGGACCVYHRGEKVVDLWGGVRNRITGDVWEGHTMVLVDSATTGLAAMTLALAHSRYWLNYEERVCAYWPEFGENGKHTITVRQLLAQQASLSPHAITTGLYENELLLRIDPEHRTLGRFFEDEIARPLGLDFYLRLPQWIPNSRLATLEKPWADIVRDPTTIYARDFEVPSGGGVGTARAIARAYSVFATDGADLGLRRETLEALSAPPPPPSGGCHDDARIGDDRFSLGFMRPSPELSFGGGRSFGSPGAGGAMGFADPDAQIGYGYVTSRMGANLKGDRRDVALRDALYAALRAQ